jgi:universal stress protein E
MNVTNTLLAVIDDKEDAPVIERAGELASRFGASIELFCCLYDAGIANERAFDSKDLLEAKKRGLEERRETLEALAAPLRKQGHEVTTKVVWDKPVYEGIVRRVLKVKPRLVLRNRHFHSTIQRAVLSNDDWNLIRVCPAPLMITRRRLFDNRRPKIWAAVDPMHAHDKPAELDLEILGAAKELAQAVNGDLHVVHTYDASFAVATVAMHTVSPAVPSVEEITKKERDRHVKRLHELVADFALPADHIHVAAGSTRKTLPGLVIENEVDVLVMGAVSRSRIKRALIGNSAEQVLERVPCDMMIVKRPDFVTPVKKKSRHELDG